MSYTGMSITRLQKEPTFITEDNSQFYHDSRIALLGGAVVQVLAWPKANVIWVLLQAGGSQWSFVTQQMQHVPLFLPWMLFGWPLLLAQWVNLDMRLYYMTIQNLVHGCGKVLQITAEGSYTPRIHCAQHVQQSSFLLAYNIFKWLKLFNSTYSSAGHHCTLEWMLQTLFTSKHHCYYLQSQNRGQKDRPPECHLVANDRDK